MTEQEQIVQDFKAKCEEIITRHTSKKSTTGTPTDFENINNEINQVANEILERHSNMPNINSEQLKEELSITGKTFFNQSG